MEFLRTKLFRFDMDLVEFVNNSGCKVLSITQNGTHYTLFYKNNEDNVAQ
jgi:hypothetical protein